MQYGLGQQTCTMDMGMHHGCRNVNKKFRLASLAFR
jgi:hypothetical protein